MISLLSNAIKFSHEGSEISVIASHSTSLTKKMNTYKITVFDEGIGICEDDLKRMFKPFFRSSDARSRQMNKHGHGIGLNICKMIAERINGELSIKSKLGMGTQAQLKFLIPMVSGEISELKSIKQKLRNRSASLLKFAKKKSEENSN